MTVCFLSSDTIVWRVLKSGYDLDIYKALLEEYREKEPEKKPLIKEYQNANKERQSDLLKDAARKVRKCGLSRYKGYEWEDILSEVVFKNANKKTRNDVFGHTDNEKELYPLLAKYLKNKEGFKVHPTHDIKKESWPDLYGVKRPHSWRERTVAVDAKVSYDQFKRFLDQATNFAKYSREVYLGATPGLVAEIGRRFDGIATAEEMLQEKLKSVSAGAIIVDATAEEIVKKIDAGDSELLDKQHLKRHVRVLYPRDT